MRIKALLPMKGHSERIPNKNMRLFAGRPLYHAIMETLLASKFVSQVIIDTDSIDIREDALKNFGDNVKIITRPDYLRGDFVSMNKIIEYDISVVDGEFFLQTHSTNPLLKVSTLDRAIEFFFSSLDKYDSLFSVTRVQARLYWGDGTPINHDPNELIRTQDLPIVYEENSNFYLFSRRSFISAGGKRIGLRPYMFEVNKLEAVDIDEEEDFKLAEVLYKLELGNKNVSKRKT